MFYPTAPARRKEAEKQTMTATVKYQVATYAGEVTVNCEHNDEDEFIIARAKRQLVNRVGSLPYGCQSFKVTERE